MQAVVHHADTHKHRGRYETVGNHLNDCAFQCPVIQLAVHKQEHTQSDKTHMADGRIRHQFFHIGLHQSHHTDINHGNQAQYDDYRGKIACRIRHNRQDKAQETIRTQFQRNCRQHHRTAGRRFNVGIRQPSVHGEHRHFYSE